MNSGPSNAQGHVHGEPVLGGAQAVHEAEMLAQGVKEQQQHHDAAGQTEVVAGFRARLEPSPAAHQPGEQHQQTDAGHKEPVIALRLFRGASRCRSPVDDGGIQDDRGIQSQCVLHMLTFACAVRG